MPPLRKHILLVEGRDDREVIYQLCNRHQIDNRNLFEVIEKTGYESVRDDLRVRPRTDVRVIGAVIDADTDLSRRWAEIRGVLQDSGYTNIPETPNEAGTILPARDVLPRVGVWVMPDNQLTGILEDFLRQLIQNDDDLLPLAQAAIDGIPADRRRFRETYRSKALIHTWLAWQEDPGTALGLAITRRYLDANHTLATRFLSWMRQLFVF